MKASGQGIWSAETKEKKKQWTLWCAMGSKPTMFVIPKSKILPKNHSVKRDTSFARKISFYMKKTQNNKNPFNCGSLIACAGHTLEKINRSCHTWNRKREETMMG